MREPLRVNRTLQDKYLDDVDHALGRPPDPLKESYRNHYSVSSGTPLAHRMFRSPWWECDRIINSGRDVVFRVTDEGRQALATHLNEMHRPRLMNE